MTAYPKMTAEERKAEYAEVTPGVRGAEGPGTESEHGPGQAR